MPPLHGADTGVNVMAFRSNGALLATAVSPLLTGVVPGSSSRSSENDEVTIWEVATGKALHRLAGSPTQINAIAFSRDGRVLGASASGGVTTFWDVQTGEVAGTLTSLSGGEWLALSPAGFFDGSPGAWNRMAYGKRYGRSWTGRTVLQRVLSPRLARGYPGRALDWAGCPRGP